MFTDPYKVLGVTPEASDDDVKKAYRSLSRRYHPDSNINNPNKALAEERFKEIQAAYNSIIKSRENGNYSSYSQSAYRQDYGQNTYNQGTYSSTQGTYGYGPFGYGQYQSYEEPQSLRAAVSYLNAGNYREAVTVLESVPERNAPWHFYNALANQGLGNNVTALESARMAAALEPDNLQYQILLKRMEGGGIWYENMGEGYGRTMEGLGKVCTSLCWLTLLCNCCFMSV